MRRFKFTILLLFIFVFLIGFAQENGSKKKKEQYLGAYLIVPIEHPYVDVDKTNILLQQYGFPKLDIPSTNFGIGFQQELYRVLFRFDYVWNNEDSESTLYLQNQSYRAFNFNFGYDLISHKNVSFYPYLGYKYNKIEYNLNQKPLSGNSFENYFVEGLDSKEIMRKTNNLDFGLGFSIQGYLLMDIRFGYLVSFYTPKWELSDSDFKLYNSPSLDYPYYLTIALGIGSIQKMRGFNSILNKEPQMVQAY